MSHKPQGIRHEKKAEGRGQGSRIAQPKGSPCVYPTCNRYLLATPCSPLRLYPPLLLSLAFSLRDTFSTVLRSGFHLRRPGPESTRGMELAGTPPQHGSEHVRKADTRNSVTCLSQPSSYHRSVSFHTISLTLVIAKVSLSRFSYRYLGINRVRERRLLPFVVQSSCVDRTFRGEGIGRGG